MSQAALSKFDGLLSNSVMASELRKLEEARLSWTQSITATDILAEQYRKFTEENSAAMQMAEQYRKFAEENSVAVQMAKQIQEAQRAKEDSIRKMLEPLAHIRTSLMFDSATKRMLDELAKPTFATDHIAKLIDQTTGSSALMKAIQSSIESSTAHARKMLADPSITSGVHQLLKSFKDANERWTVPSQLLESVGAMKALQEQIGKVSLPVMDAASAGALATLLGPQGIVTQLAALGINPDGSLSPEFAQQEEKGIGLSRKTLELMTLLSFIFAILVPLYQEYSSAQWQATTDQKLASQADVLNGQTKVILALSNLVEKALAQEARRNEERFVVLDRVAHVRSEPAHGSAVVGKLLPREVVRPISEQGKWIEFEYYHWLHKEFRTGWALKKYFQRVPSNFTSLGPNSNESEAAAEIER